MKEQTHIEGPLNILSLEDSVADFELIHELLIQAGPQITMTRVEKESEFVSMLRSRNFDIILADFKLPGFDAFSALRLAQELRPYVPLICVSGSIGEEVATELIKSGAVDYVLKDRMKRLPFAINRALAEAKEKEARQKAEMELKESELNFRTLADSGHALIWTSGIDGGFNYFNRVWLEFTGRSLQQELGMGWMDNIHTEDRKSFYEKYNKYFDHGEQFNLIFRLKRFDNKYRWLLNYGSPRFDSNRQFIGYIGHCLDITERKQMEEDLIQAKNKAEESDRLKTAFLNNISHEVRTPMNAIIGFSSFLNHPDISREKRTNYTDVIIQSSHQLLSIITDIINISTVEAGQERVWEKEMNLNSLLRQSYEYFTSKAPNLKIHLSYQTALSDDNATIKSDEIKLQQIINNLVGNALKFTSGGTVNFGYHIKGQFIEFFVEDSGIGISENMFSEIFKLFRQVETTTTRLFGGSGLGLSIAKAYVELLGGKIWLKSQLGKGSTFYFTIPYKVVEETLIEEPLPLNTHKRASKVLIAEDEEYNFLMLVELLAELNLDIIRAKNGKEAVEICRTHSDIDLILMDLKMPVLDGFEATRQIKKLNPDVPVIAQTAYTTDRDKERAFACGCTEFVSKPFKLEQFLTLIQKQLDNH